MITYNPKVCRVVSLAFPKADEGEESEEEEVGEEEEACDFEYILVKSSLVQYSAFQHV